MEDSAVDDASDADASDVDASDGNVGPSGFMQCPAALPAPTTGACDVTDGAGTAVMIRGTILGDVDVLFDGSVLYDGDHIVCVGCDCSAAAGASTATVINCGNSVVSPGLINAFNQSNYDEHEPLPTTVAGGTRYEHRHEWRAAATLTPNSHTAMDRSDKYVEIRHMLSGTTSVLGASDATGGVRNLRAPSANDLALGFTASRYELFPLGDANMAYQASCAWPYSNDVTMASTFSNIVTRIADGINAYASEEIACLSFAAPGSEDFFAPNVQLSGGIALRDIAMYGMTADAALYRRLGGLVALGTTFTGTGSATMLREMACVAEFDTAYLANSFSDQAIWRMATRNAAQAIHAFGIVGRIAPGYIADLAVFRADEGEMHGALLGATSPDVVLVVRDGDVLYGEADVVNAIDPACDPIDICGEERRICATRELGESYATISAAVAMGTPSYPAVFCGLPANEPTCLPSRTGEYAGSTGADPDGDGRTTDNCPNVFNPVRPIDMNVQPDDDADGTGDACDVTPLRPDLDDDTVLNDLDNCPLVANTTQLDTDTDTIGDACDACPSTPNFSTPCP